MKKITMVNTGQIVKRGWKGLKSSTAVQNFAKKHHVPYTYWRAPGASRRIFLVEYDQFCEIWREWKHNPSTQSSTRKSTRKTTSSNRRTRKITRKPVARKTTSGRTTTRRKTSYRSKTRTSPRRRYSR